MNIIEVPCDKKVYCPFCKKKIYAGDDNEYDLENSVCEHVIYNHDSENIYYLSPEAKARLYKKGFDENIVSELMYNEEDYFYLRDILNFPNSIEFEIQAGGMTTITMHIAVNATD